MYDIQIVTLFDKSVVLEFRWFFWHYPIKSSKFALKNANFYHNIQFVFKESNCELEVAHGITYKHVTHVFHVETTWKRSFPCRFKIEYTWCVCRVHCGNGESDLSKELTVHLVKNSTFKNSLTDLIPVYNDPSVGIRPHVWALVAFFYIF